MIDKQLSTKTKISIEKQLGWIAILIILDHITEASKQAVHAFKIIDEEVELWHHSNQPYFISFYLGIIFKYSKMNPQVRKMKEIMEICRGGWNDICSDLLEKLSQKGNPNSDLEELAHLLSSKIPNLNL